MMMITVHEGVTDADADAGDDNHDDAELVGEDDDHDDGGRG